jgi:hypothetical protein
MFFFTLDFPDVPEEELPFLLFVFFALDFPALLLISPMYRRKSCLFFYLFSLLSISRM